MRRRAQTDSDLIARVRAGDQDALDVLHGRYYPRLYKLAYVRLGSADDAHDVASETFVRAILHVRQLHPLKTRSLYPWLHAVAMNLITDFIRRRSVRRHASLDDRTSSELMSYIEQIANGSPPPDQVLHRKEVQETIRAAIASLPEAQATSVLYRFLGEMSIREMAEAMGRSEGAVKSLLHRAIVTLRTRLSPQAARRATSVLEEEQHVHRQSLKIHR
ncbi:MAG: RNA polymerase sigma factor [Armatimonadota bacterium]